MAIVVLEHSDLDPSLRLGKTLRDYGHRLRVRRVHRGEPVPADLDDVHGVISMGGEPSSNDASLPWLAPEMAFLRAAHAAALPVVGICLGCQVLARALGGEVGPVGGPGIEIGWQPVTLTDAGRDDIVHSGIGWSTMQFHWHREMVTKLPPGARALASSKLSPVQAWSIGLRTYAFQFHPEVEPATIDAWIADDPEALAEGGITEADIRGQTQANYAAFHRITQRLFEQIALLLMPVDRINRGLVKDLMH
jgi:GMP synthase-like glutamine amidotransferase